MQTITTDVIIIGAGPAGCATALQLKKSGLKIALIDKSSFPRDKICGDAIPSRAIKALYQIDPILKESFNNFPKKLLNIKTLCGSPNGRTLEINWSEDAYVCTRYHFDNELIKMVKTHNPNTTLYENTPISHLEITPNKAIVKSKKAQITFEAPIIIGADGAHSIVAKTFTDTKVEKEHYGGAVRAYFDNVKGMQEDRNEIYWLNKYLPGYFWIFPLPNNQANIGFGMLSKDISNKKINLKKATLDFIETFPGLKERFADSEMISKIEGFGLPFGSKKVQVSGDRFLLIGDAAYLVNPLSGDGIGNAMVSGKMAGEQIVQAFETNDFSATNLAQYDKVLYDKFWSEHKTHAFLQRIGAKFPWLMNLNMFLLPKLKKKIVI